MDFVNVIWVHVRMSARSHSGPEQAMWRAQRAPGGGSEPAPRPSGAEQGSQPHSVNGSPREGPRRLPPADTEEKSQDKRHTRCGAGLSDSTHLVQSPSAGPLGQEAAHHTLRSSPPASLGGAHDAKLQKHHVSPVPQAAASVHRPRQSLPCPRPIRPPDRLTPLTMLPFREPLSPHDPKFSQLRDPLPCLAASCSWGPASPSPASRTGAPGSASGTSPLGWPRVTKTCAHVCPRARVMPSPQRERRGT